MTICEVAVPIKVCVIFGLDGNRIGGVVDPSPKSQIYVELTGVDSLLKVTVKGSQPAIGPPPLGGGGLVVKLGSGIGLMVTRIVS